MFRGDMDRAPMMTCDVPQHRSVEKPVAKERPVIYVWRVRRISSDITKGGF